MSPRRAVAAVTATATAVLAVSLPSEVLHTAARVAAWAALGVGVAWALLTGATLWALVAAARRDARAAKWTAADDRRLAEWRETR